MTGALGHILGFFFERKKLIKVDPIKWFEILDLLVESSVVFWNEVTVSTKVKESMMSYFGLVKEKIN